MSCGIRHSDSAGTPAMVDLSRLDDRVNAIPIPPRFRERLEHRHSNSLA